MSYALATINSKTKKRLSEYISMRSDIKEKLDKLKADIKHYFQEVDREILIQLIQKRIADKETLWLIQQIIKPNFEMQRERESNFRRPAKHVSFVQFWPNEGDAFRKFNISIFC